MYNRLRFKNGCLKAFTLSYDDGCLTDMQLIDVMAKYGVKGTFNLNSSMFDVGDDKARIEEVYKRRDKYLASGNEVACHGVMHYHIPKLTYTEMADEILGDRKRLEKEFGVLVRGMAYAYGSTTDEAVDFMKKCGICYSRVVGRKTNFDLPTDWLRLVPNCHHDDEELFTMADNFLAAEDTPKAEPMLFYVWGHSSEFQRYNNWDRIEKLCETVGGKKDIWYATNIEIYDYIKAYESLIFSAQDGRLVYNPTATDVWFSAFNNKTFLVKAGETIKIDF